MTNRTDYVLKTGHIMCSQHHKYLPAKYLTTNIYEAVRIDILLPILYRVPV